MALYKESILNKIEDDLAGRNQNWDELEAFKDDVNNSLNGSKKFTSLDQISSTINDSLGTVCDKLPVGTLEILINTATAQSWGLPSSGLIRITRMNLATLFLIAHIRDANGFYVNVSFDQVFTGWKEL